MVRKLSVVLLVVCSLVLAGPASADTVVYDNTTFSSSVLFPFDVNAWGLVGNEVADTLRSAQIPPLRAQISGSGKLRAIA
jgi:hypothetical protein